MRIHYIQNDPIVTLGSIEQWAKEKSHTLSCTKVFENESLPSFSEYDLLIILGGRMGAYEEEEYPWLAVEKQYIYEAIHQEKFVLGICLGAQMIADVLGGRAYPHTHKEIGWWPIKLDVSAQSIPLFKGIPQNFTAFEFHGDTFDLPEGAILLGSSRGCENQVFVYGERVIGLQFHPEFTTAEIGKLEYIFNPDVLSGEFVQQPCSWGESTNKLAEVKSVFFTLLNNIESNLKLKVI